MVEWLAGNRIRGTSTERTAGTPEVPAVAGGWKELARTTLGSNGDSIDVSSLADKRYLMFLLDSRSNGTAISTTWKANGSTGNEYSFRRNHDGTEGDANTQPSAATSWTSIVTNAFGVGYAANKSGKEKLFLEHEVYQNTAGAGTAPTRTENAFKWTGTDVIDQLTMHNSSSGDIVSGSELVVLGYDPADTHTTNFWEELADVPLSSAGTVLSSGTFTAKKYLWVQAFIDSSGGNVNDAFRCGNGSVDNQGNYSYRFSSNGSADTVNSTTKSQNDIGDFSNIANGQFINMFIINNASNEKLIMCHINEGKSGSSSPTRLEIVGKWANTSDQINIVEWRNPASTNYSTKSFIKVWGSN